jgi:uncharacterized protein (TIGR03118 family)
LGPHVLANRRVWVADAGAGVSTLYNTVGAPQPLVVSIPASQFNNDPFETGGIPTGAVFNIAPTSADQPGGFKISGNETFGAHAPTTASAVFLFATKQGAIVGWNPGVDPAAGGFDPAQSGKFGIVVPKASSIGTAAYTGLAIATDANHITHLYAANFKSGTVDVFDGDFNKVSSSATFVDPTLPSGYAPFNVAAITVNGKTRIFVTYAIPIDPFGQGRGIVNSFELDGSNPQRFAQHGQLNAPWGMAVTPSGFGALRGTLWIGNFGDGRINAYGPMTGAFIDKVRTSSGKPVVIDRLWSLRFGNGGTGGDPKTLYFTAGPNGETDGLFGSLDPQ